MRRVPGILWIAAGAALWGTDTVLRRPLTGALGPTQIVLYEHIVLAIIVAPILIRGRAYLSKIPGRSWLSILGIAWIGSALATVLFTAAIRSGNPNTAVLLQKTQPLFAIFLARAALQERWPKRFPLIACVALAGAYLLAFGGGDLLAPLASVQTLPALLALGASVGWAASTIWGRIAGKDLPFEMVTALRFVCALPALMIAAAVQDQMAVPSYREFASLTWIALVPGFAGLMLYYRGLRQTPASLATIGELAFPAVALLLNWSFFGATATSIQLLGFGIVWAAIFSLSKT
jgi:drug/metabolite transporter (DMT)-like permease